MTKKTNIAQLKVGVDMTTFLLGKIQNGKLNTIHILLVKGEIVFRTQQLIDDTLGIRALALIIRKNEKKKLGKDLIFF